MQVICLLETWVAGIEPPIRRRLEVPADLRLSDLHVILQIAFGWTNSHLHQFIAPGNKVYGDPSLDPDFGALDENDVTLEQVLPGLGEVLEYEYDFGDSWLHPVVLWGVSLPERGAYYPRCTGGKRAGPPEDCGGIPGYMELVELLADPRRRKRADFEPEAFSPDEVNRELARLFQPPKPAAKKKAAAKKKS